MTAGFLRSLYQSTINLSAPLILCSLGGLISLHSGVVNVAMEGMMLSGAFTAVAVCYVTSSPLLGVLAAIVVAVVISLIYSLFVTTLKTNNFVIGIAINIFVSSFTIFLTRVMFVGKDAFNSPDLVAIPKLRINFGVGFLNVLFSNYSILVYVAVILVFVIDYVVYKTPFGLWLRAAGSKPEALSTAGKNLVAVQYVGSVLTGILCGLSGSQLSLSNVVLFTRDMSAGRGFICLAVIIIAQGRPKTALLMSLLFGFFNALSIQLQYFNIPPHFLTMIPYVMAILALVIMSVTDKKKLL